MDNIEVRRAYERRKAKQEGLVGLSNWWTRTNTFGLTSPSGASPMQCICAAALVVAMFAIGGLFPS